MGELRKSIRVLTDKEIEEMLNNLAYLQEKANEMMKKAKVIEKSGKNCAYDTPEYNEALRKKETANIKQQLAEIYEYMNRQVNSPWSKWFRDLYYRKKESPFVSLTGKLRKSFRKKKFN